jgi:hypothetical protein
MNTVPPIPTRKLMVWAVSRSLPDPATDDAIPTAVIHVMTCMTNITQKYFARLYLPCSENIECMVFFSFYVFSLFSKGYIFCKTAIAISQGDSSMASPRNTCPTGYSISPSRLSRCPPLVI